MQKKSNEDEAKENSFNVILVPWHFFGNSIKRFSFSLIVDMD